ncbi:UDP-N-acetylmuramoyl-L-alanyl-D-glutamate--2,6-diaminopimelate ligase [Marinobacter sp.]|uniref:UDP-N-acetylmuramoyl-L-alanyl-D-glutamate--2, 6-diaminopimelate ligase n=1 Tax=Marinobacter sp. TaxID=50741 RepID=UPI002B48AF2C|nr:UDP-N-acetylmuramoyl-L-alanyl-D-glutamate--2,6-diaminopimelate ligase [Marinobacter sp.]HKK55055.1 UDP-N-acetylmuramoyl-L-alanyl-D-glutamate--2,6-diaminopimelate ligase [Marinobacter sp.]
MCMSSLRSLLEGVAAVPSVFDVTIHGLATDSRKVSAGDAFLALAGSRTPADQYVGEAIAAGAAAILLETGQAGECYERAGALLVPVENLKARLGMIADRFYEHPSQRLRLIGVTGTNGKTSVSHYIASLFQETGTPCGVIGTLGYGMPDAMQEASHTTPDVVQVNRVLSDIIAQGGRAAAMEVSSHALDQGRVDGLNMTGAVFTNLTRDHLDYHGSMAAYGAAKARLFEREELHFAVINFDDPFGRQLYEQLDGKCDRVRFSLHEAQTELWLTGISQTNDGFSASVDGLWGAFDISASIMGSFNVSNLLASMAAVLSLGVPVERVQLAVKRLVPPPGRLEPFTGGNGVRVIVDYAHTADALENALAALRPHVSGRLICVFGCGGDRDTGKRPAMAAEAERGADLVFVTDDNPRSEDPAAITDQILAGFAAPEKVTVIHDRAEAIRQAIAAAEPGDIVLIAGKGHESWQETAGQRLPFSDAGQVLHLLSLNGGAAS